MVDFISQLLDFYELPESLVFSDDISYQELLILGLNKQGFNAYMSFVKEKARKKAEKKH